jgi:predicted NUDIX family NTP pyrophosphohydrolase
MVPKGKHSAGILLYRTVNNAMEVLLVHPGGPFWKNKDAGAWTIPKGEPEENESLEKAALREFFEETGYALQRSGKQLSPVRQKAGKWIHAWAIETDLDPGSLRSNEFELEWPPKSGIKKQFPEIDKFNWFPVSLAREKINPAQAALLNELELLSVKQG